MSLVDRYTAIPGTVFEFPSAALLTRPSAVVSGQPYYNGTYFTTASSVFSTFTTNLPFNKITSGTNFWNSAQNVYFSNGNPNGTATLGGVTGEWIKLLLPATLDPIFLTSYSIQNRNDGNNDGLLQSPVSWSLLGSNDDVTWTVMDTQTAQSWPSLGLIKTFNVSPTRAYSKYAICVRSVGVNAVAGCVIITQIRFYGFINNNQENYVFPKVLLLMRGDNFNDSSSYNNSLVPHLWTQNGPTYGIPPTISTTVTKFGRGSLAFNTQPGADIIPTWLKTYPSSFFNLDAEDFTIEFWFYSTRHNSTVQVLMGNYEYQQSVPGRWSIQIGDNSGVRSKLVFLTDSYGLTLGALTLQENQWYHCAIVRNGAILTQYINGTADDSLNLGTTNIDSAVGPIKSLSIGASGWSPSTDETFFGYMEQIRFTKGFARYTGNFTAPTAPFPSFIIYPQILSNKISNNSFNSAVGIWSTKLKVSSYRGPVIQVKKGTQTGIGQNFYADQAGNLTTSNVFEYPPASMSASSTIINNERYVVIASSEWDTNYQAFEAFDKATAETNTWHTGPNGTSRYNNVDGSYTAAASTNSTPGFENGEWLQLELPSAINVSSYSFTTRAAAPLHAPRSWRIVGSNNGSSWVSIDEQSGITSWTAGETKTYTINSPVPYRFYRFIGRAVLAGSDNLVVAELRFFEQPASPVSLQRWLGSNKGYVSTFYNQVNPNKNFTNTNTSSDVPDVKFANNMCMVSFFGGQTMSYSEAFSVDSATFAFRMVPTGSTNSTQGLWYACDAIFYGERGGTTNDFSILVRNDPDPTIAWGTGVGGDRIVNEVFLFGKNVPGTIIMTRNSATGDIDTSKTVYNSYRGNGGGGNVFSNPNGVIGTNGLRMDFETICWFNTVLPKSDIDILRDDLGL